MSQVGNVVIAEFDYALLTQPGNVWVDKAGKRHNINMAPIRREMFALQPFCARCGIKAVKLVMVSLQNGRSHRIDAVDKWGTRLSVDHVEPRCRGGKKVKENAMVLCQPCNSAKGSKSLAAFYGMDQKKGHPWHKAPEELLSADVSDTVEVHAEDT